jgi:hypothetical protein
MTNQHRATTEQWETVERYADYSDHWNQYPCFLELRARIEALEAAQQPHQDKMDRLIAIDRDDPANWPVEQIATDTLRALCAELTEALDSELDLFETRHSALLDRARAALAQQHVSQPYKLPEPVAPTQGEAVAVYTEVMVVHDCQTLGDMAEHFARAVLARWGQP